MEQTHIENIKLINIRNPLTKHEEAYGLSLDILGQGKYAKVHKAVNLQDSTKAYAVKVIQLKTPQIKEQCLKELKIIQHLPKSPNLVFIHKQHLQSEHNLYIFEEFCEGGCLSQYKLSRTEPFTQSQIFDLFFQVTNGFRALYKSGIIHEDIKPNNILLRYKFNAFEDQFNIFKLCDFGVSQLLSESKITNIRRGTISFMPPEKLKKKDYLPNAKSDIYSLGVTMYEMIFGKHPYIESKSKSRYTDYKEYLKLLSNAVLKPLNQVLKKEQYENMSIKFQKFYRILERMLELSENKRINFEELQQYLNTSEPFTQMSSSHYQEQNFIKKFKMINRESLTKINYNIIGKSTIETLQGQNCQMPSIINPNRITNELINLYYAFIKRSTSYLKRGVQTMKNSKQHQTVQKYYEQSPSLKCLNTKSKKVKRIMVIQFLINYLNWYLMSHFLQKYRKSQSGKKQDNNIEQIEDESRYLQTELFKCISASQIDEKKELINELKENSIELPLIIKQQFSNLFNEINSVRINYKDDILALLFIKNSQEVLATLKILDYQPFTNKNILDSKQVLNCERIIKQFEKSCVRKTEGLWSTIEKQIKSSNHMFLEDDQENSDQWEILQFSELNQLQFHQNRLTINEHSNE